MFLRETSCCIGCRPVKKEKGKLNIKNVKPRWCVVFLSSFFFVTIGVDVTRVVARLCHRYAAAPMHRVYAGSERHPMDAILATAMPDWLKHNDMFRVRCRGPLRQRRCPPVGIDRGVSLHTYVAATAFALLEILNKGFSYSDQWRGLLGEHVAPIAYNHDLSSHFMRSVVSKYPRHHLTFACRVYR